MQRIYLPHSKFSEILEITDKEIYHQLTRVMRARLEEQVIFFDGKNNQDIVYRIIHIDKKSVSLKREESIEKSSELPLEISLYQWLPNKLSKLETIVQKCCEIGYRNIVFFIADHSQKFVLWESKKQRIQKIAIEAVEQSGGNYVPEIQYRDALVISEILRQNADSCHIFCHTQSEHSLTLRDISFWEHAYVNIFVGPEWGFSQWEVTIFEENNIQKINFWERILRCETVAPAVWFYISQQKK